MLKARGLPWTAGDFPCASLAPLLASWIALSTACTPEPETGGIAAHIVFPEHAAQHALRAESVPSVIGRLQIVARDVAGSTLAATNLYDTPTAGQLKLEPQGGTWSLQGIAAGSDRQIVGRAYLRSNPDPRISGLLLFQGSIRGINVKAGELANAGVLQLARVPGVRYPPLDTEPPDAPNPITATSLSRGRALSVSFTRPRQDSVAGYIVAIGESSAVTEIPSITRGRPLSEGDAITQSVLVRKRVRSAVPEVVIIDGLDNDKSYTVLAYAYDNDLQDQQLNYSQAASAFGVPKKIDPPGAIQSLSITLSDPGTFEISFVAPGDIGDTGTPDRYDIRISMNRSELESASAFQNARGVLAPPVQPAGERVTFRRTAAELMVSTASTFFIGARAIDTAGNVGPIAVADYLPTGVPLRIDQLEPEIAITGIELAIRGQGFGATAPMVTVTGTSAQPIALPVTRFTDQSVNVQIVPAARSGTLTVRRSDGQSVQKFLPVITRIDRAFDSFSAPFELIAADPEISLTTSALYRERNFAGYEGAIERRLGILRFGDPLVPMSSSSRSTAIAGMYSRTAAMFYFVASNQTGSMTGAFAPSPTRPFEEGRVDAAVPFGGADGIGLAAVTNSGRSIGAMIAFSTGGVVRTATVDDARTQAFGRFTTYSSTVARRDNATLQRLSDGTLVMAYRETRAGRGELALRTGGGTDPQSFVEVSASARPRTGPGFLLLPVPFQTGEEMVVVYEAPDATGQIDIRILRMRDYGRVPGYAPFLSDPARAWRLEDAGLIQREDTTWIVILASKVSDASAEVRYTEVPLNVFDFPPTTRGLQPGVVLDTAAPETRGRVGCKLRPLSTCPLVWAEANAPILFVRR